MKQKRFLSVLLSFAITVTCLVSATLIPTYAAKIEAPTSASEVADELTTESTISSETEAEVTTAVSETKETTTTTTAVSEISVVTVSVDVTSDWGTDKFWDYEYDIAAENVLASPSQTVKIPFKFESFPDTDFIYHKGFYATVNITVPDGITLLAVKNNEGNEFALTGYNSYKITEENGYFEVKVDNDAAYGEYSLNCEGKASWSYVGLYYVHETYTYTFSGGVITVMDEPIVTTATTTAVTTSETSTTSGVSVSYIGRKVSMHLGGASGSPGETIKRSFEIEDFYDRNYFAINLNVSDMIIPIAVYGESGNAFECDSENPDIYYFTEKTGYIEYYIDENASYGEYAVACKPTSSYDDQPEFCYTYYISVAAVDVVHKNEAVTTDVTTTSAETTNTTAENSDTTNTTNTTVTTVTTAASTEATTVSTTVTTAATTVVTDTTEKRPTGDANGDDKMTVSDAAFIARTLAKRITISIDENPYADYNGDGKVTVADAAAISRELAKAKK